MPRKMTHNKRSSTMPSCEGCCVFPHGRLSIYAMVLGISSYLFMISSTWGCYYMNVEATFSQNFPGLLPEFESSVGLFSYEDVIDFTERKTTLQCYYYTPTQLDFMDGSFGAARAFGILGNIVAGLSMITLIAIACVDYPTWWLRLTSAAMVLTAICQGLTFLMFQSTFCDFNCKFYIGAGMAVGGIVVSLATAWIVCRIPPSSQASLRSGNRPEQPTAFAPGTKTVTEAILPDGTRKITTTTVHADGSKTIEEELHEPQ